MQLSSFEAEDVTVATGQLKIAILRLDTINKLPADINTHLVRVLQTSSVKEFSTFFHPLKGNIMQILAFKLFHFRIMPDSIIDLAHSTYFELKERGLWNKTPVSAGPYG